MLYNILMDKQKLTDKKEFDIIRDVYFEGIPTTKDPEDSQEQDERFLIRCKYKNQAI